MRCARCGTFVQRMQFRPVLDAAALDVGEGRCLEHPGKDAVDACSRCGGYVCDVCVTRTGEHVLCPACFDLLHGRGELATTRLRRVRWDRMSIPALFLGALVCGPIGVVVPIYALWRWRTDRWLSPWMPIVAIVLTALPIVAIALVALLAAGSGS